MKPTLLTGIQQIIDAELRVTVGNAGYKSRSSADNLNKERPRDIDLCRLVDNIWKQLVTNWVEGGCACAGACNWRWKLNPSIDPRNTSSEIKLQRNLMALAKADPANEPKWSNETPTASGLSGSGSGEPGHLDLAYMLSEEHVIMIELKVGANHPVYAGIQLVVYALMLVLARLVKAQVRIATDERWLKFKRADLRVLAPTGWYAAHSRLGWFERDLNEAVMRFGETHDLALDFGFRCFDDSVTLDITDIISCLGEAGRVSWQQ